MLKIILLGPPGSGKGTQAELLSNKFLLKHISTGELLRKAILSETDLGLQAKALINSGKLVSDDIIINIVKHSIDTLNSHINYNGLILDGFPRNLSQAQALAATLSVDCIIYLNVPDNIIIKRLAGRRYHPTSGRIYHIEYNPPKIPGIDDITGEPLIVRPDDQTEIIQQRLDIYHQNTEQLIDWYKMQDQDKFIEVDGACHQVDIANKILSLVEPMLLNS